MTNWRKELERLEGAYSDHTLRAHRSGFVGFASWCRAKRVPALRASPAAVLATSTPKTNV